MDICKLTLQEKYQPEITGLGDIYEEISVERKRKTLRNRFNSGVLFLAPNRGHSTRGLTLRQLENRVEKENLQILAKGFVDSPFWPSRPRPKGSKSPFLSFPVLVFLATLVFKFLVKFESLWEGRKESHMVYVLGKRRRSG